VFAKARYWITLGLSLTLSWATFTPAVMAEARRIDYTLNSGDSLSYALLVQQADIMARDLVQRSFAESSDITEVYVRVMGEHNGLEAPLLYVMVSRTQWQSRADVRTYTRYFGRSSAVLLGLVPSQNSQAAVPIASTASTPGYISDTEPNFYQ
jgi:hypothetical protein